MSGCDVLDQWPNIRRFLWRGTAKQIEYDFCHWSWIAEKRLSATAREVGYEEWAAFFEWQLRERASELAEDRVKRHLVEQWTDDMTYTCRRAAAWARGVHPGKPIPQHERRPDLDAERKAIVADIVAKLEGHRLTRRAA